MLAAQVASRTGLALVDMLGRWRFIADFRQFLFKHFDALDQAGDRLGHWVGQDVVVEADAVRRACRTDPGVDDPAGNTDDGPVGWHVLDDNRVGTDANTFADADRAENLGAGPDDNAVSQRRVAFALVP